MYKYELEKYKGMSSKHFCPNCGKKTLVMYVDTSTGDLMEDAGRCDREQKCGYHQKPEDNSFSITYTPKPFIKTPRSYLSGTFIKENSEFPNETSPKDKLFRFLMDAGFERNKVLEVWKKYFVGYTDLSWRGSTVFFQIDSKLMCRTGKIMLYNDSGKRVKKPYNHLNWMHSIYSKKEEVPFHLEQCLFGEHLLRDYYMSSRIALVESEKTALIGAIVDPSFVWIATGGLSNLSPKKLEILRGMDVRAFPDKGSADYWKDKLEPLGIEVSYILEDRDDVSEGEDLADIWIDLQIDNSRQREKNK